jgi:hypothetical protein
MLFLFLKHQWELDVILKWSYNLAAGILATSFVLLAIGGILYGLLCTPYLGSRCGDQLGSIGGYILFAGALVFLLSMYVFQLAKRDESNEKIDIMPILRFHGNESSSENGAITERFAIKNVGYGSAKNTQLTATLNGGKQLCIEPVLPEGQLIGIGELRYWDVKGVKAGEEVEIEVKYTDILDNPRPILKFRIIVP